MREDESGVGGVRRNIGDVGDDIRILGLFAWNNKELEKVQRRIKIKK